MYLLIYYIWVGYRAGDASPDPSPNLHGFLKHLPPPPHYNSGSGKTRPIRGGAKRVPTGRMQIAILNVHSFLMGLNDSFVVVRGEILIMEPLPGINKVFSLVQNHEKQKEIGIFPLPVGLPTIENIALLSRMDNGMNQVFPYFTTGSTAFPYSTTLLSQFDNRQSQYSRRHKPTCSHCGFKGHIYYFIVLI